MKETLKLGVILLLIAGISGLILGAANEVTKEPIAIQSQKEKSEAMKEILPSADEFKVSDKKADSPIISEINEGIKGGKVEGYAIKVSPKGYGGAIEMMVGITQDGKVSGIKILSHTETPGLGANAPEPKFSGQYKDKPAKDLVVVKTTPSNDNEIEAITGATITSRAVTSGVNEAIKLFNSSLKGGK